MHLGRVAGRLLALCAVAAVAMAASAQVAAAQLSVGKTYFVSSSGSDSNAGTSPLAPWRTVGRVNNTTLNPGDTVLFQGGATFSDDTLIAGDSGTSTRRITFGSYGAGRATLTEGIWFSSVNYLTFENLAISGPNQGILASGGGSGADHILIRDVAISDVGIGINSANAADDDWTIVGSEIDDTGDSGLILQGTGFTVAGNTITDTGTDASLTYGKHGIYLKAADARVTGNTIRNFSANGVSARYRNSVVEGNVIENGAIGIAWFQEDGTAGTSEWRGNRVAGTTDACIYVSASDSAGATSESFVIAGNVLSKSSGVYMDLEPTTGTYTVQGNAQV
jgi:putative cofactor-binding repeat protein